MLGIHIPSTAAPDAARPMAFEAAKIVDGCCVVRLKSLDNGRVGDVKIGDSRIRDLSMNFFAVLANGDRIDTVCGTR